MPSTPVTIYLEGDVPFQDFATAIQAFWGLISNLSREVSPQATIHWTVESLEVGSATATARGESESREALERVADAYLRVGKAQEERTSIPYSPGVVREAEKLVGIVNGNITAVRFLTGEGEATVYGGNLARKATQSQLTAGYGAVTGRIQTLSSRGSLRFTLYDLTSDRAVHCYLAEGQEEIMRDAWGELATVEGWVSRDRLTGRPISIRRVSDVSIREDVTPGSFTDARGAVPAPNSAKAPEDVIREWRDA